MTTPTDQELEQVANEWAGKAQQDLTQVTPGSWLEQEVISRFILFALKQVQPTKPLVDSIAVSPQEQISAEQNVEPTSETREDSSDGLRKAVELAEWAWTIIANASGGDWSKETPEWVEAARKYEKQFHEEIRLLLPASYWYLRDLVPPPASTPSHSHVGKK